MWRAEQNFLAGCGTFKKETLQKHNIGGGHLRAQDAALAKQKPVENSTIAQSFQKGEKASEEKKPERRCSQNKHGLFNSKGRIALKQV